MSLTQLEIEINASVTHMVEQCTRCMKNVLWYFSLRDLHDMYDTNA